MKKNKISFNQKTNYKKNTAQVERFLYKIEKYIAFTVMIMLLGLLHTADGMSGYPLSWLKGSEIDIFRFFMSAAIVMLLVISADVLNMIRIKISEPETDVQRTLDKYASTYTEYEDPLITEVKYNTAPVKSKVSASARASSEKIRSKTDKYEKAIASDYDKIKSIIQKNSSWNSEDTTPKAKTVEVKQLLNGKSARKKTEKNGTSVAFLIAVIAIVISMISSGLALIFDDGYDDTDWTPETYEEDTGDFLMFNSSDTNLTDFMNNDFSALDSLGADGKDIEAVSGMLEWSEANNEHIYTAHDYDVFPQEAVVRYRIVTEDGNYLVAFKYECDDFDAEDEEPSLTGFAICPYWDQNEENEYSENSYFDYDQDDELFNSYSKYITNNSVSIGDDMIADISILLW